jgi:hypothetical protein
MSRLRVLSVGKRRRVGFSRDAPTHPLSSQYLALSTGYASGDPLSNNATYLNFTFADLKVAPGTHKWTWGDWENQNFTLVVGPGPGDVLVPEPTSISITES